MKRNMNKILGATAMLLVSVLMLGTASFAWFAMNTRSVANGLTVEAYSDSNFLEISKDNRTYDTDITYTTDNTGLLRLVTYKRFNTSEIVTIVATPVNSGTYAAGNNTPYYRAVQADTGINYIHVPMTEDDQPSSTKGLFKNPTFTLVTSDAKVTDDQNYYKFEKNSYVRVPLVDTSAKGYYYGDIPTADTQSDEYDGQSDYYSFDTTTATFTPVYNLHVGTDLTQYYTIAETAVTITDTKMGDGTTVYYLKNGNDYSYVGKVGDTEYLKNYLYWGRAYSDKADDHAENATLNIIDKAKSNEYYLQQTLYLRQAEGTNLANNLRVKDIRVSGATNDLYETIRVLLVASSVTDDTNTDIVTVLYDAGNDTYNGVEHVEGEETVLFSKLLGNEAETIKVDVYIFFDGTDTDAKNTTLVGATLNGQSVEIEFTIDELSYNK